MTVQTLADVEFGTELPVSEPDTSLAASASFAEAVGYSGSREVALRLDRHPREEVPRHQVAGRGELRAEG